MRFVALFLALFLPISGLSNLKECYSIDSYNTNKLEPGKMDIAPCLANNSLCFKETTNTKRNGIIYKSSVFGCDSGGTYCLENGVNDNTCKKKEGGHFCCCDSNLCNLGATMYPRGVVTLSAVIFNLIAGYL